MSITGTQDGGVPSKSIKLSISSSPVHIKIRVNDKPTDAIIDTGSAISIINLDFIKTMQHNKFVYQNRNCRTANSTPLNIIGHIELTIKIKRIETFVVAYVATNLITPILLGNDWIDTNHVHLFGDQKYLTLPDQHGQLTRISYMKPQCLNYPALLIDQINLPPYSQTVVEMTSQSH